MILQNRWADLAIIVAAAGIVIAMILWYVAVIRPDRRAKRGATFPVHELADGTAYVGDEPPDELVDAFADLRDSVMSADHPDYPITGGETTGAGRHRYRPRAGQRRPIGYGGPR